MTAVDVAADGRSVDGHEAAGPIVGDWTEGPGKERRSTSPSVWFTGSKNRFDVATIRLTYEE